MNQKSQVQPESEKPIWVNVDQAAKICGISRSMIRDACASRRIDPRCGHKVGNRWVFKREVLENENLLLID